MQQLEICAEVTLDAQVQLQMYHSLFLSVQACIRNTQVLLCPCWLLPDTVLPFQEPLASIHKCPCADFLPVS